MWCTTKKQEWIRKVWKCNGFGSIIILSIFYLSGGHQACFNRPLSWFCNKDLATLGVVYNPKIKNEPRESFELVRGVLLEFNFGVWDVVTVTGIVLVGY